MPIELQIADGVAELAVHGAFEEFSSGTVSGLEMLLQRVREVAADPRLERDVCLRVCGADEALTLNKAYRGGSAPTNILSFTAEGVGGDDLPLGDLALCWPVAVAEAEQQHKAIAHHVAHLCVHGLLHLLDYDHVDDAQAETMERIEVLILSDFGVADPYK